VTDRPRTGPGFGGPSQGTARHIAAGAFPDPSSAPIALGQTILVAAVACAVLAGHILTFSFVLSDGRHLFLSDDALISLRYADRLIHGRGLTWNDNEPPVEGYSNLLWILAVSALGIAGVDLILAARILGCLGMAAVIAAAAYLHPIGTSAAGRGPPLLAAAVPPLTATLALALTGPIAVWAIGGMEQALLAALVAWAFVLLVPFLDGGDLPIRALLWPGLLFGLAALTRPDGAIFPAAACLGLAIMGRCRRRAVLRAAALGLLPAMFYLGQMIFRLAYYGDWVPNTAYAKLAFSVPRLQSGLTYVGIGLARLAPLVALAAVAVAGAFRAGARRGRALVLAAMAGAWLLYLVIIGGDVFPAWRHLVIVAVAAAFLSADGLEWMIASLRRHRGVFAAAVGASLGLLAFLQATDAENNRARTERWEWDGQVVGRLLRAAFGPRQPLLATDLAGCIPYFSGLPTIDMLGLNDRWLARHPPADFGTGQIGHELGDGTYVLGRNPDLVGFTEATGALPRFRVGLEMVRDERFFSSFQPVMFEGEDPRRLAWLIWVRREGGRIGIRREANRVTVPAFFLAAGQDLRTMLGNDPQVPRLGIGSGILDRATGEIGCLVRPGVSCGLADLPLAAGRWNVAAVPPVEGVRIEARCGRAVSRSGSLDQECTIDVPAGSDGLITLVISTAVPGGVHLQSLVLTRVGEPRIEAP
jgi:arabinofuranosyltransferase